MRALVAAALVVLIVTASSAYGQAPADPASGAPPSHADHARPAADERQASPPAQPHDHGVHGSADQRDAALPPFIPVPTDAARAAAFPDVVGHAVHGTSINYFVLFDQLEWQTGDGADVLNVDTKGWVGRDVDRLWFRAEGEGEGGDLAHAEGHVLYGRAIARWWDVVAGVRHDVGPGPERTWAAVGVQGLAPYWFDVEATAYVGAGGRTHVRIETEYELLVTNRLVLQPLVEVEIYGKDDTSRGIAAGLSSADLGVRVRYEFRREFAPYVGVTWNRKLYGTADLARADGDPVRSARLALGLRLWF